MKLWKFAKKVITVLLVISGVLGVVQKKIGKTLKLLHFDLEIEPLGKAYLLRTMIIVWRLLDTAYW